MYSGDTGDGEPDQREGSQGQHSTSDKTYMGVGQERGEREDEEEEDDEEVVAYEDYEEFDTPLKENFLAAGSVREEFGRDEDAEEEEEEEARNDDGLSRGEDGWQRLDSIEQEGSGSSQLRISSLQVPLLQLPFGRRDSTDSLEPSYSAPPLPHSSAPPTAPPSDTAFSKDSSDNPGPTVLQDPRASPCDSAAIALELEQVKNQLELALCRNAELTAQLYASQDRCTELQQLCDSQAQKLQVIKSEHQRKLSHVAQTAGAVQRELKSRIAALQQELRYEPPSDLSLVGAGAAAGEREGEEEEGVGECEDSSVRVQQLERELRLLRSQMTAQQRLQKEELGTRTLEWDKRQQQFELEFSALQEDLRHWKQRAQLQVYTVSEGRTSPVTGSRDQQVVALKAEIGRVNMELAAVRHQLRQKLKEKPVDSKGTQSSFSSNSSVPLPLTKPLTKPLTEPLTVSVAEQVVGTSPPPRPHSARTRARHLAMEAVQETTRRDPKRFSLPTSPAGATGAGAGMGGDSWGGPPVRSAQRSQSLPGGDAGDRFGLLDTISLTQVSISDDGFDSSDHESGLDTARSRNRSIDVLARAGTVDEGSSSTVFGGMDQQDAFPVLSLPTHLPTKSRARRHGEHAASGSSRNSLGTAAAVATATSIAEAHRDGFLRQQQQHEEEEKEELGQQQQPQPSMRALRSPGSLLRVPTFRYASEGSDGSGLTPRMSAGSPMLGGRTASLRRFSFMTGDGRRRSTTLGAEGEMGSTDSAQQSGTGSGGIDRFSNTPSLDEEDIAEKIAQLTASLRVDAASAGPDTDTPDDATQATAFTVEASGAKGRASRRFEERRRHNTLQGVGSRSSQLLSADSAEDAAESSFANRIASLGAASSEQGAEQAAVVGVRSFSVERRRRRRGKGLPDLLDPTAPLPLNLVSSSEAAVTPGSLLERKPGQEQPPAPAAALPLQTEGPASEGVSSEGTADVQVSDYPDPPLSARVGATGFGRFGRARFVNTSNEALRRKREQQDTQSDGAPVPVDGAAPDGGAGLTPGDAAQVPASSETQQDLGTSGEPVGAAKTGASPTSPVAATEGGLEQSSVASSNGGGSNGSGGGGGFCGLVFDASGKLRDTGLPAACNRRVFSMHPSGDPRLHAYCFFPLELTHRDYVRRLLEALGNGMRPRLLHIFQHIMIPAAARPGGGSGSGKTAPPIPYALLLRQLGSALGDAQAGDTAGSHLSRSMDNSAGAGKGGRTLSVPGVRRASFQGPVRTFSLDGSGPDPLMRGASFGESLDFESAPTSSYSSAAATAGTGGASNVDLYETQALLKMVVGSAGLNLLQQQEMHQQLSTSLGVDSKATAELVAQCRLLLAEYEQQLLRPSCGGRYRDSGRLGDFSALLDAARRVLRVMGQSTASSTISNTRSSNPSSRARSAGSPVDEVGSDTAGAGAGAGLGEAAVVALQDLRALEEQVRLHRAFKAQRMLAMGWCWDGPLPEGSNSQFQLELYDPVAASAAFTTCLTVPSASSDAGELEEDVKGAISGAERQSLRPFGGSQSFSGSFVGAPVGGPTSTCTAQDSVGAQPSRDALQEGDTAREVASQGSVVDEKSASAAEAVTPSRSKSLLNALFSSSPEKEIGGVSTHDQLPTAATARRASTNSSYAFHGASQQYPSRSTMSIDMGGSSGSGSNSTPPMHPGSSGGAAGRRRRSTDDMELLSATRATPAALAAPAAVMAAGDFVASLRSHTQSLAGGSGGGSAPTSPKADVSRSSKARDSTASAESKASDVRGEHPYMDGGATRDYVGRGQAEADSEGEEEEADPEAHLHVLLGDAAELLEQSQAVRAHLLVSLVPTNAAVVELMTCLQSIKELLVGYR